MEIDSYIHERLRADAAHAIALAECESAVQHAGLRGRLREILISNLLAPWLPPFCKCVTGMIIESRNKPRHSTQEDILIIDTSLGPPVLANAESPEGIFLFNSVLLRIEVKSKITAAGIREFLDSSHDIVKMDFDKHPDCKTNFTKPCNILVGFGSDSDNDDWDFEFERFCQPLVEKKYPHHLSGFVSAFCVIDKGFWWLNTLRNNERTWCRLDTESKEDRLVWVVANASNTAFKAHAERQGRDSSQGLEIGSGRSIPINNIPVLVPPVQTQADDQFE